MKKVDSWNQEINPIYSVSYVRRTMNVKRGKTFFSTSNHLENYSYKAVFLERIKQLRKDGNINHINTSTNEGL